MEKIKTLKNEEIKEMSQVEARRIEEYPNVCFVNWLVDIMDEDDYDDEFEEE